MKRLSIALVGRPNVGKSSLFNRLTGTKSAIVSSVPGTTRDRKVGAGNLVGLPFQVVDTGGLDDRGAVSVSIQEQVQQAMHTADVVLFMLDGKAGVTSLDHHFAKWLRKRTGEAAATGSSNGIGSSVGKEILLLVNKTEGAHLSDRVLDTISDALRLGLGEPLPVSATHGDGLADLATTLIRLAAERGCDTGDGAARPVVAHDGPITLEERVVQLAIMGRPNVGKSSMLNAFLGEERVIVGPTPGLTRDAISVEWQFRERLFRLVDTAGLTRIRTDKALLHSPLEAARRTTQDRTGSDKGLALAAPAAASKVNRSVELPGIDLMQPDEDPSQFSHQVSEMALISALNALRFAQVVLIVIGALPVPQPFFLLFPSPHSFRPLVDDTAAAGREHTGQVLQARPTARPQVPGRGPRRGHRGQQVRPGPAPGRCAQGTPPDPAAPSQSRLTPTCHSLLVPQAYEDGVREHCEQFMREFGEVRVSPRILFNLSPLASHAHNAHVHALAHVHAHVHAPHATNTHTPHTHTHTHLGEGRLGHGTHRRQHAQVLLGQRLHGAAATGLRGARPPPAGRAVERRRGRGWD